MLASILFYQNCTSVGIRRYFSDLTTLERHDETYLPGFVHVACHPGRVAHDEHHDNGEQCDGHGQISPVT